MRGPIKKLYDLEKNILPKTPSPITFCLENEAEIELNRKANNIKKSLNFDVLGVWHNNNLTFEQKQKATIEAYERFSEKEKQIITNNTEARSIRFILSFSKRTDLVIYQ